MATSSSLPASQAAPAATIRAHSKSKQKKMVVLRLSPTNLAKFPTDATSTSSKSIPATPRSPTASAEPVKAVSTEVGPGEVHESGSSTPLPQGDNPSTPSGASASSKVNGAKRKAAGQAATDGEGPAKKQKIDDTNNSKARGKPGPKKRKGMDGEGNPAPTSHKMNPKANTGAINANLRALDLTGTKTRRWLKKGVQLTSFTGRTWDVSRWNAPPRGKDSDSFEGDVKSEETRSSELNKQEPASSVIQSDRSQNGEAANGVATPTMPPQTDIASSPAPQATEAVVAA